MRRKKKKRIYTWQYSVAGSVLQILHLHDLDVELAAHARERHFHLAEARQAERLATHLLTGPQAVNERAKRQLVR